MKFVKKYELIQPKTGDIHRLFGVKYLSRHKMRDNRWTAQDKVLQYTGLTKLYKKDYALSLLNEALGREEKRNQLKNLKQKLKEKTLFVQTSHRCTKNRVRTIMKHEKAMELFCSKLNLDDLVVKIDDRTYFLRRQLDNLNERKRRLTEKYEQQLLEVATFQDRVKYHNLFEPKETKAMRRYEVELKNSETRIRALSTINRAYKKIIDLMLKDAIFYDSVLAALKEDLEEQEIFIQKTILLGKPALEVAADLFEEHQELEVDVKQNMDKRQNHVLQLKNKIKHSSKKIGELVRRDDDFEVYHNRYDRDTPKIIELNTELDQINDMVKQLKLATLTCDPQEMYPKMKEQTLKNQKIVHEIERKEKELDLEQLKNLHGSVIEEKLKYDLTDDEIAELTNIESLEQQITDERKKQQEIDGKLKERGEHFVLIRLAFQHVNEVLQAVGTPLPPATRQPKDTALTLPLLKFNTVLNRPKPPKPFEDNIDTLLTAAKTKIEHLIEKYKDDLATEKILLDKKITTKNESKRKELDEVTLEKIRKQLEKDHDDRKWKDYHKAIVAEFTTGLVASNTVSEQSVMVDTYQHEDHSIPTRDHIKEMSARLVKRMARRQDY